MDIVLNPPTGLRDTTIYPDEPGSSAAAREQIQSVIDQVVEQAASKTQEAWIAPTLLNGWSNIGLGNAVAGYMKDTLGFVHIKAVLQSGTITDGTIIFTLPAGYRPLQNVFSLVTYNDGTSDIPALVSISANGNVTLSGVKANNSLIVFVVPFRAEQ